jgi:tRNA threonylcarbamoyladenosine biosynthesis protein TsaB
VKLLALDTSTEWCSVAVWHNAESRWRAARAERGHGEQVLQLIDELLGEVALSLTQLDAIAFGCGPGAFTGVRLAASITQGLAFSAGLPVMPVSTLRAIAQQALWPPLTPPSASVTAATEPVGVLVCQDARMGEVYWGGFQRSGRVAIANTSEAVGSPASVLNAAQDWLAGQSASGAGSGFSAYPELAAGLSSRLSPLHPELGPHAREIALLAAHAGLAAALPPEQAQPVYLRNDVAAIPANPVGHVV